MFTAGQFSFFSFPTSTTFGVGALATLPGKLHDAGAKRVLLVTDRFLASHPIVSAAKKLITEAHAQVSVFSHFSGNPVLSHVELGVQACNAMHADSIVAIGGGSALDVAKAIALMSVHEGCLFDYANGTSVPTKPLPMIIAIPTTAGTGSELGRSTVISEDISKKKHVIFHPVLLPKEVILDPNLTADLPANIVAATGFDALSHLLESFIAPDFHPICDGIALEGLRLLAQHLPKAFHNAEQHIKDTEEAITSRAMMLLCASMGAVAFQKGLGATHSAAHALSTVCDLHHGLANGIMIPYVMQANEDAAGTRFARVRQTLGLDTSVPEWLFGLKRVLNIPSKLSSQGVKKEHLSSLVDFAFADGCHQTNPRPMSKADFHDLFTKAL